MKTWLLFLLLYCGFAFANVPANATPTDTPGLIPMPQSVQWSAAQFNLAYCKTITIKSESLSAEAKYFARQLRQSGFNMNVVPSSDGMKHMILLELGSIDAERNAAEAYRLSVSNDSVVITGNTPTGVFHGMQTLLQLISAEGIVAGCKIVDYPAYQWRGYMVDVGRNYQSTALMKQQIDVMARYKLNVFHFHLTEDIAWRLQIKKYPRLTSPQITQRNKDKYYSVDEVRDIIAYCRERHIILVPEIDIPGHSGAFVRAMGVDMQSEEGTAIVKDIFEEICSTYDVPYIHIGADEVQITNKTFIADISKIIRKHKKQIIAWSPGGNYDDGIIRQLWKDEEKRKAGHTGVKYIDSKFLYISDFDPLNSVVTIFNRQIDGKPYGDSSLLGAEFCLWNDRNVSDEKDLIGKNPVYPSMLAFSERTWRGGGYSGVVFSIGEANEARARDFTDFESRLLRHKRKYFRTLPFVYVHQTHIKWKLFGPFENGGDLSVAFWPEKDGAALADSAATLHAVGGTVWLRHTHGPPVKAWLPSPRENTTWYAYTRFWSNTDSTISAWIDLKDLSRSGADATPPEGQWDYMQSKIWINKKAIAPPRWTFPGRPSGRLNEPMVDETFYYRPPMSIDVRKGWNEVVFKLPMGRFNPNADWQVPPKWMFTLVPVHKAAGINWEANEMEFRPDR